MARGREAEKPTQIPAAGWKDVLFRVKDELSSDRVGLVAAGVAFYGLLAIFPGIGAVMALAGLLMDPATVVEQLNQLSAMLPAEAAEIIVGQAQEVAGTEETGLGFAVVLGILISIYSASKGVQALMQGMNIAYDEDETRGFIKTTALTLALTLGLIIGLILAIAIAVGLPILLAWLPIGQTAETLAIILRWPLLLLIAFAGLSISYRYGPSRDAPKWRWAAPGAALACILWVVGTGAFAVYVRLFGSYNETFGALGGVIILLMWLWLSAYVVLLGAEVGSEMEAQTKRDSTTGPREPMGRRGAAKADKLGSSAD